VLYSILFNSQNNPKEAIIMFLIGIIVFFVSLSLHEFAHGLAAYKMGDITPKVQGRLTLNPIKHLDSTGFICFILFGFGWAKPIQINPLNFKKYKKGCRIVSIVGVLTNVLLGLMAAGIYAVLMSTVGVSGEAMYYVYILLSSFMLINSYLALFNLIPLFPLDGYNFLVTFFKKANKFTHFNERNGNKVLIGLILVSLVFEILFNFDVLGWYLSLLYDHVFTRIALLGIL